MDDLAGRRATDHGHCMLACNLLLPVSSIYCEVNNKVKFKHNLPFALVGTIFLVSGCDTYSSGIPQNVQSTKTTSNVLPTNSNSTSTLASSERQVQLLQNALAPSTPRNAADTWAKSIQTRNGALQFAILTPQLQKRMKYEYVSWNWSPGASSPWIEKYSIGTGKKVSDTKYKFVITYTLTDSTHNTKTGTETIEVTDLHGHWYVSSTGGYGASAKRIN